MKEDRDMMKRFPPALMMLAVGIALAGCEAGAGEGTPGSGGGTVSAELSESPTDAAPVTSVELVWSHTAKWFGDTQIWYVARVSNPSNSVASLALDARALDSTGTIVGSSQEVLPNIPAHGRLDFFGHLGGGGFNGDLTGTPARIEVSQASHPFGQAGAIRLPMLKTSEIKLARGNEETDTDAPYSYNLRAKVTNTTDWEVTEGITQQVVLYDEAGRVVGGGTGLSDNVPDALPAGMSYREVWTGIPAIRPAVRAVYDVWPWGYN
jgi:hypothetical protein